MPDTTPDAVVMSSRQNSVLKNPSWQRNRPRTHHRRCVWLLKFVQDSWWNQHLAEKSWQNCFRAAQEEVMQRRSIRDDATHGRARIFSRTAFISPLFELRIRRRSGRKRAGARTTFMFAGDNFVVRSICSGQNGKAGETKNPKPIFYLRVVRRWIRVAHAIRKILAGEDRMRCKCNHRRDLPVSTRHQV